VGVADASVSGSQLAETPRLVPFANIIYHNRNRSYNPQLGRFMQADPNASGIVLSTSLGFHGWMQLPHPAAFDVRLRYGDGFSLVAYLRSNPMTQLDPFGLFVVEDPLQWMRDRLAQGAAQRGVAQRAWSAGAGMRRAGAAGFMGNIGRMLGALWIHGSYTPHGVQSDIALGRVVKDSLWGAAGDFLGATGVFPFGLSFGVDAGLTGTKLVRDGQLGNTADMWGAVLQLGSDLAFLGADVLAGPGQEVISKSVGGWFSVFSLFVGMYTGILEYELEAKL
jgi:hypothetical protein